jgi:hypothetical protein
MHRPALIHITAALLLGEVICPAAIYAMQTPLAITLPAAEAQYHVQFTHVTHVRELSDGSVIVVDDRENTLTHLLSSAGPARVIGRTGAGPAEYRAVGGIYALRGDSSLFFDRGQYRLLLLDRARLLDIVPAGPFVNRPLGFVAGADTLGRLLLVMRVGHEIVATGDVAAFEDSVFILLGSLHGGVKVDTIARLGGGRRYVDRSSTMRRITSNPLNTEEQAYLFPDGWIAVARLDPYRVEWRAPDGSLVRGESLPFREVPVDDRLKRAALDREAQERAIPRRSVQGMVGWPRILPAFLSNALQRTPDGLLLVLRSPDGSPLSPVRYDAVGRNGRLSGIIVLSAGQRIVGVGRNSIFVASQGAVGLETLRRHPYQVH